MYFTEKAHPSPSPVEQKPCITPPGVRIVLNNIPKETLKILAERFTESESDNVLEIGISYRIRHIQ